MIETPGAIPGFAGLPVLVSPWFDEDTVRIWDVAGTTLASAPMVIVGSAPLSPVALEARRIVRRGLADWLAYIGEPVEALTFSARFMARLDSVSPDR